MLQRFHSLQQPGLCCPLEIDYGHLDNPDDDSGTSR